MSKSLVRRTVVALVKSDPAPQSPAAPVAPTPPPWSVAKYLRRLATVWAASWVSIVVTCLIAAAHRVSFADDAIGATVIATLITGAAATDLRRVTGGPS